jgi:DNA polymerase family A
MGRAQMTSELLLLLLTLLAEFEEIWLADFEFIPAAGEHPDVVCLCARELRTGRTLRLWRTDLDKLAKPPYRTDDKVLFVCFVANAECACHLVLGWPLPKKIFDLSPVFRCVVNGRKLSQGKGLVGALAYFGLEAIDAKYKDDMRKRILEGWPFTWEEREKILEYCLGDTTHLEGLLAKLLPHVELATALHWGEFAAVSAVAEHRGVPIDMETFPQLQDKHAWAYVRDALVPKIDAQYGVFTKDAVGEWHFSNTHFEDCCARLGVDWPRKEETGKIDMRRKTWQSMCKSFPVFEPLRQLRHARDKMRKIKLAVGGAGRNRTVLWPFQSKTSRTQPKASQWVFSPAVWTRSLIKPGPTRAVAYIDWSSMEFQVAAVITECEPMLELYATGSPYIEFAKRFDEAPPDATKKTEEGERIHERYKVGLLGAQYQMQYLTLAQRLGVSTFVAHEMLSQHGGLFRKYWVYTEDWIAQALNTGIMWTPFGWTLHTGIIEFNARSIGNFFVQASSADILRLATVWMHRRNIEVCGTVHDAVLIEAPIDRIEADVALAEEIMRRSGRVVLNTTDKRHDLRTSATIVKFPNRYVDKRGVQMWEEVLKLLEQYRKEKGQCSIERRAKTSS